MEAKHTPGPWVAVFTPKSHQPSQQWCEIKDAYGNGLAEVFDDAGDNECTIPLEQNGYLMAAAPDLLVALELALPWLGGLANDNPGAGPAYRWALAAIAKATSSTPSSALPAEGSTAPVIEALPVQQDDAR